MSKSPLDGDWIRPSLETGGNEERVFRVVGMPFQSVWRDFMSEIDYEAYKKINSQKYTPEEWIEFCSVFCLDNLYQSLLMSSKESNWKYSTQAYLREGLIKCRKLRDCILSGKYEPKPFFEFEINERGKKREVRANHVEDRVVRRCLCDFYMNPNLEKYLIEDNCASRKDYGISKSREKLEYYLHHYYNTHHTNHGYILLLDYSRFYDNIRHDYLLEKLFQKLPNRHIQDLITLVVRHFKLDVSYMTDGEYQKVLDEKFNLLEYQEFKNAHPEVLKGERYLYKSLGIGDQVSQTSGIFFPTEIDNFVKIVEGNQSYGRYMDDSHLIHEDKKYLLYMKDEITRRSLDLGMYINPKKSQVKTLEDGFTFLHVKYKLLSDGHLVKNIDESRVTRERRKLKKYKGLVDSGKLKFEDVKNAYLSWVGQAKPYLSSTQLHNIEYLWNKLFYSYELVQLNNKFNSILIL